MCVLIVGVQGAVMQCVRGEYTELPNGSYGISAEKRQLSFGNLPLSIVWSVLCEVADRSLLSVLCCPALSVSPDPCSHALRFGVCACRCVMTESPVIVALPFLDCVFVNGDRGNFLFSACARCARSCPTTTELSFHFSFAHVLVFSQD